MRAKWFAPNSEIGDTSMKNLKNFFKKLWRDESAQGATEYILLLVVIVGLVLLFGDKIKGIITGKVNDLGGMINSVTGK